MSPKQLNVFLTVCISVILSSLMLYATDCIPSLGVWYSFDQSLRLQSEAFLRGEIAVQPVPYGHRHDWIWANGMHQSWGLGVPLLQLPFQLVGKIFGSFGFPDRIIFLIFYGLVAAIMCNSFILAASHGIRLKEWNVRLTVIPIICFALLHPGFINMLRSKFGPYEDAISYAYLWTFMCFALLYKFIKNRQQNLYFVVCFLAGFSLIIRPTHGAYGTMTFLIAAYHAHSRRLRIFWMGFPLFISGILFFITTNYFRFGSPLEFGPNLSLTGSSFSDYMVSFDNPVHWYPFTASAIELVSALFFIDFERIYTLNEGLLWQSNKLRWLELNFKPFDLATLVLLLLGWAAVIFVWKFSKKESRSLYSRNRDILCSLGIWSFASFFMLFLFYSRWPGFLSRYLVDFGPAIVAGITALYLLVIDLVRDKFSSKISSGLSIGLAVMFSGWIFYNLSHAAIIPLYGHLSKVELTNVTDAKTAKNKLIEMRSTQGPPLPDEYRCGDKEGKYDIMYNNANWDIHNSCMVNLATTHFLDQPKCLEIEVAPFEGVPDPVVESYLDEIEVSVGIERFRRISENRIRPAVRMTFCSGGRQGYQNPDYVGYKVIKIKWANLRKHNKTTPPFRLMSIKRVNQ